MTYYSHFNLPMDRSSAFGPTPQHYSRTFRTRFRFAFAPEGLKLALQGNSPDHAKGTPSPIKDRALTACKHLVSGSFPPRSGVLITFPSRYWFAIAQQDVLSLRQWAAEIHARFLVPDVTRVVSGRDISFPVRGCHPLRRAFPSASGNCVFCNFLADCRSAC